MRRGAALTALLLVTLWPGSLGAAFEVHWPSARAAGVAGEDLDMLRDVRAGPMAAAADTLPADGPSDAWTIEISAGELYGLAEARGWSGRAGRLSGKGLLAVEAWRMGSDLYEERGLGLGLSRRAGGGLVFGFSIRSLGVAAAGLPDLWTMSVDVNLGAVVLGKVAIAGRWENVGRARIGDSPVAARTVLGAFLPLDGLSLGSTATIEDGFDPAVSFGCEGEVSGLLRLRAGVSIEPSVFAVGVGLGGRAAGPGPARPALDLAWQWHPELGVSAFVSVTFGL